MLENEKKYPQTLSLLRLRFPVIEIEMMPQLNLRFELKEGIEIGS